MDSSGILLLVGVVLSLLSTRRTHCQQQSNVVQQAPSTVVPNPPIGGPHHQYFEEFQKSLNKFIYQLHQTGDKVVSQPPQHPPLLFPALTRHSDREYRMAPHPLVPLAPPSLFPSSFLVPTPSHLPPTFRLPATVMAQHKAFPMDGLPPHPMLVFSSIVEQQPKAQQHHQNGVGIFGAVAGGHGANGTSAPATPTTLITANANSVDSNPPKAAQSQMDELLLLANTVPEGTSGSDEGNENAVRAKPKAPLAMPIANETTTKEDDELPTISTDPSDAAFEESISQKQIFLVPGGGQGVAKNENGTMQPATAVDLEEFLRSANLSAQDTKRFLGLVEQMLEQEVARRLELSGTEKGNRTETEGQQHEELKMNNTRSTTKQNIAIKTDGQQIVLELAPRKEMADDENEEVPIVDLQNGDEPKKEDDELEQDLLSQKELKTANTRLFSLASGEEQQLPNQRTETEGGSAQLKATTSTPKVVVVKPKKAIERASEYKQREQADFDQLLDRLRAEEGADREGFENGAGKPDDADLLLIVPPRSVAGNKLLKYGIGENRTTVGAETTTASSTVTTSVPTTATMRSMTAASAVVRPSAVHKGGRGGGMMLNRQHQFWSRHGPKTKFERLVEDYRWRLSGQDSQNGLNDLIKALQNAHIGFFNRMANPASVKILRRIS